MRRAEEELELMRLLAAERGGLEDGIDLLRGRGPDVAQLASLSSRLALQGIDVAASATTQPVSQGAWKKWLLGGVGGASAVVLWLALRVPAGAPVAKPIAGEPVQASAPAASLTVESPAPTGLAKRSDSNNPEKPKAAVTEANDSSTPEAATDEATRKGAAPPTSPEVRPEAETHHSTAPAAPPLTDKSRTLPAMTPATAGSIAPPAVAGAPSEIELLRDARFALKQSPARALELTEQHSRLHPRGKLTQERELIAITALVALGRRTAALSRGANFERAFPTSPYQGQVNELLR